MMFGAASVITIMVTLITKLSTNKGKAMIVIVMPMDGFQLMLTAVHADQAVQAQHDGEGEK